MSDEPLNPVATPETEEPETGQEDSRTEKDWAAEAHKFQDLYLRTAAEMENMRRRFQREKEEQSRFAAERLIKGLLPVLDNLGLALNYVGGEAAPEVTGLAEGVKMTLKGCLDVLAENGVRPVEAGRGQAFDPNVHEALGHSPEPELPAGSISQEVQKGYLLHQRLLRPAKVIVAASAENNN